MISCIWICTAITLQAQNLVDEEGRKTGHWKVEYPSGKTLYEADFVEGQPVGEMVRYYETGAARARMCFEPGGSRSAARLYYSNGKLAAEGWYLKQMKDSVWTYYSEFDGSVRIREPYQAGKLHGVVRSYYASGEISEEVEWKQDVKEGPWIQYFKNGALRLSATHKNGLLEGPYKVFLSDRTIQIRGLYRENKAHGTWIFYDESGKEAYSLEYRNGSPVDREKYEEWMEDSLKNYLILTEPESLQQP
ncbi:MAG: toxin-antitoxin system YwqK family antitoxin [Bacteroidales bacterium]|nr:toxin-antitoxin system YwqK family antitoxin [Bacteroidales bacterium]